MLKKVILIICVLLIYCEFISAKDDDGESINGKKKTPRQFSPLQRQVFVKWQNQYDITFENAKEENEREKIFHDNLARINAHNADPKNTYKLGLNHLTHYTPDEIISTRCQTKLSEDVLTKLNEQQKRNEVNFLAKKVVCFWDSKSVLRSGSAQFTVENINPNLCTHIIYTFYGVYPNGSLYSLNPSIDFAENNGHDSIAKFLQLRSQNPNAKLMISIGGPSVDTNGNFQYISSTPESRTAFANSALNFIQTYGFDGIDIFWRYPTSQDRENYVLLLKQVATTLENRYYFTLSADGTHNMIVRSYDIFNICNTVDFVNLLAFDYHRGNEHQTGLNSQLYNGDFPERYLSVNASVTDWLTGGCASDKLILGIPTYGRAFKLLYLPATDIGSPTSGSGRVSSATGSEIIPYYESCVSLKCYGWTRQFVFLEKAPYIYSGDQWISYDDQKSVGHKIDYLLANSLGGAMVYSIDLDDFSNVCCNESFPLLSMVYSKVISSFGIIKSAPIWNNEKVIYTSSTAPASVDWSSYLLPVQDQGQCGSCWAFQTTAQLESMAYFGNSSYNSNLSPQYLVNCVANGDYGCNGGWPQDAMEFVKGTGGMPTISTLPYVENKEKCNTATPLEKFPIRDVFFNYTQGNEEVLKAQVANYGPTIVVFNVTGDFGSYTSGVYTDAQFSLGTSNCYVLNHVLLLIGYGTDPNYGDYWLARNSWGSTWGDQGVAKIARGQNVDNIGCFSIFSYQ